MAVLDAAALQTASQSEKRDAAETLVNSASAGDKKEVAQAAANALTPEQRAELAKTWIPSDSKDRMIVYVVAIVAAVIIAIGLTLIAADQQSAQGSISSQIMTAMTGITGLILGGLFGAYRGS